MDTSYLHTPPYIKYLESWLYTVSVNMRDNNGETFPQSWAHSELFTMLMGWALDLLSFVVCSVLSFSCYSEAKVASLTMLC